MSKTKYHQIVKYAPPNEFMSPDNSGDWRLVAVIHLSDGWNQYFWERSYAYSAEGIATPPLQKVIKKENSRKN